MKNGNSDVGAGKAAQERDIELPMVCCAKCKLYKEFLRTGKGDMEIKPDRYNRKTGTVGGDWLDCNFPRGCLVENDYKK